MRLATIAGAATILIVLAGCGARNPVAPVEDAGSGAGAADQTFVLSSALDPRLPAPMAEAAGATAADLAITGAASIARGEQRAEHPRASADPVVFWNQMTTTLARGAGLPPPRFWCTRYRYRKIPYRTNGIVHASRSVPSLAAVSGLVA